MNDIIFNVPHPQGATILLGQPWDSFLPPLAGSFFGVIAAFWFNYRYQAYRNKEDKNNYINMFRSEIMQCIFVLKQDTVQLLPVDLWTSAVNSGALKLFNVDELAPVSIEYDRIKNYNDMAVRSELIGEYWKPLKNIRTKLRKVERIFNSRYSLLDELKKLKNADWLNPASMRVMKADEAGAYWR